MKTCIIPARGGSKRIANKNLKAFQGKPIIAYSIEAVFESQLFDDVIVSTDSDEIAETALKLGASVPFVRPIELANDYANTFDVVQHSAQWLAENRPENEFLCCVYATAPFIHSADLIAAFHCLVNDRSLDYVYAVTEFSFPIQRAVRFSGNRIKPITPENMYRRSQDLPKFFHDAGQFYWGTQQAFQQRREFFGEHSTAIELPAHRVVDIDTPEDWLRAELYYQLLQQLGAVNG